MGDPAWAQHVLNVRFRLENVEVYPPETFITDDGWIRDRRRYILYKLDPADFERLNALTPRRGGSHDTPTVRGIVRRGTKPVEYTPEHARMQAKLMTELQSEFGREHVCREQDFVDVRVETPDSLIFYEIKTDLDPSAVIRQALGQILEYAYYPGRPGRPPDRLVIVGRSQLRPQDAEYLEKLKQDFRLPLDYRVVSV